MKNYKFLLILIFTFPLVLSKCSSNPSENTTEDTLERSPKAPEFPRENSGSVFELLPSSFTGVDFNNKLVETNEINFYRWEYLYNGGGVGIGDVNNDGLSDLYFTSTIADDKLYLNRGNMKFEDITIMFVD